MRQLFSASVKPQSACRQLRNSYRRVNLISLAYYRDKPCRARGAANDAALRPATEKVTRNIVERISIKERLRGMMFEPWTEERIARVGRLIRSLNSVVKELEEEFVDQNRKFTLDGHLVGSIGEVVAAYSFGLTLYPTSRKGHDAEAVDGRGIQIKLTGGKIGVALSSEPEHLIVLQLRDCKFTIVYNGLGAPVWRSCGVRPEGKQRPIRLSKLQTLDRHVGDGDRLVLQRELPDLSETNLTGQPVS
jgi:hypothetical protein